MCWSRWFLKVLLFLSVFAFGCDSEDGSSPSDLPADRGLTSAPAVDQGVTDEAPIEDAGSIPILSLNSIRPNRGAFGADHQIQIIGLGFTEETQVTIGREPCILDGEIRPTQLTCRISDVPMGTHDVTVRWRNLNARRDIVEGFEIYAPLQIARVEPDRGHASGGQEIWLKGSGLTQEMRVRFGENRAEVLRVVDGGRSARVVVPAASPGEVDVFVDGLNGRDQLEAGFTYFEPFFVSSVAPLAANATSQARVILSGGGLRDTTEVRFGNVLATQQTPRLDGRRLDVVIPPNAQRGLVDIVLSNSTANEPLRLTDAFLFYSATSSDEIVVDDFVPKRIPVGSFATLYVVGQGFVDNIQGRLGTQYVECDFIDPSLIQCDVMSPEPGTLEFALVHEGVDYGPLQIQFFEELVLTEIVPARGSRAGGTLVTVTGSGFRPDTEFLLGDAVIEVTEYSPETVVGRTAPSGVGLVDLTASDDARSTVVVGSFEYFDPSTSLGGVHGDEIGSNLNVTVLNALNFEPISDAQVIITSLFSNDSWRSRTDNFGQVTFGDPDLTLPVSATAASPGFFIETLDRVTAEDTTFLLFPIEEPEPSSGSGGGDNSPLPVISGELTGLYGFRKPTDEGVVVAAFIESTSLPMPSGEILTPVMRPHLMLEDGEFELTVQPGEFALVGMGGYLRTRDLDAFQREEMSAEELRNTLVPLQMGVLQNVMVDLGDTVEGLSLRLDAPMNQQTNVTFANPPGGGTGPNTFALDVDLIFPSDGYYNFGFARSEASPNFEFVTLPDLSRLPRLELYWTAEAIYVPPFVFGPGVDQPELRTRSTVWYTSDANEPAILIEDFVGTLSIGNSLTARRGRLPISWTVHSGYDGLPTEPADCHLLFVYKNYEPVWISVIPGAATGVELPLLLAGEGVEEVVGTNDALHILIESSLYRSDFSYSDFSLYDVLGAGDVKSQAFVLEQIQ